MGVTKKISNSKYRNTGVLFELLVRQVTADTLNGKQSPALNIMTKYFNTGTALGQELQLYRAFFEAGKLTESRAINFIDMVLNQRVRLDERQLAREKYNLVKEIKESYDLKDFLSSKIPNYVVHASIYKTFMTESMKDTETSVVNIRDIATAKFTLIEHLIGTGRNTNLKYEESLLEEFHAQNEDLRMLTYKILVEKFNAKYSGLNDRQKGLLREYINNVSNSNTLSEYVKTEIPVVRDEIRARSEKITDKVLQIKLHEVAAQLDAISAKRQMRDSEITALMIAYEILKEIEA